MKNQLREKIERNIEGYYPNKNFFISRMARVRTKPQSLVFVFFVANAVGEQRVIYAKQFEAEAEPNIYEMLGLKEHWSQMLTPRIIDYFENDNIVLFEGVRGNTLSKNLILNSCKFGGARRENQLLECAGKLGHAIGHLQRLTKKGRKKIGELDIFLINQFESEKFVKEILGMGSWTEVWSGVERLKDMETTVAQIHGDPTPHNIIMKESEVYLLDFSFQTSAVFLDPVLFIVSLDLMRARLPFTSIDTISEMGKIFLQAYSEVTNESWDRPVWSLLKLLTYLHVLFRYKKRKKNLKNLFVASLDKRYLLNQIQNLP